MAESKATTQPTAESKFPSEMIDLPSGGKLYPKGSPLRSGKIEIKYMTAREEDILTSQNLIKKGLVIDSLLNALIVDKSINVKDLFLGDKNAIMVAARILAYGPEYTVEMSSPVSGDRKTHTFNLSELDYKSLPDDIKYDKNEFSYKLPFSGLDITYKILNGIDEDNIEKELKALDKIGTSKEITTRLKKAVISINGETDAAVINAGVENMIARDSLAFRKEITRITPDILLEQTIEMEGEEVTVDIPMAASFFWPT
tara:strand:- start:9062 stop:9832 length:771 start_codon:yes stop_codon:yes gene_type:complete